MTGCCDSGRRAALTDEIDIPAASAMARATTLARARFFIASRHRHFLPKKILCVGKMLLRVKIAVHVLSRMAGLVGFSSLLPRAGPARLRPVRTVLIVLFDGVQSLDVTGPLEVFAA